MSANDNGLELPQIDLLDSPDIPTNLHSNLK
jgi:hypothetical protein